MKYPRLPANLDRRRKLMPEDIKKIRKLRKSGVNVCIIAIKFKVSTTLIYYWTNEKLRQRIIKRASEANRDTKARRERQKKSIQYIRKVNPKYVKYMRKMALSYYHSHKNKK